MVGDVGERTRARRRGEDERHQQEREQRRAPRIGAPSIERGAGRVEREHGRSQEEAGVGVGPDERQRNERDEHPRSPALGALERQQQIGEAEEGAEVRALDEARLGRPGGQRQRRGCRGRVGAPPERDAKEQRPGREHEGRLQQHRPGDPAGAIGEREDDLEQPGQVQIARIGVGEGEQVRARNGVVPEDEIAEPQVEEEIGLVHRDEAASGDEQQERGQRRQLMTASCRLVVHGGAIP